MEFRCYQTIFLPDKMIWFLLYRSRDRHQKSCTSYCLRKRHAQPKGVKKKNHAPENCPTLPPQKRFVPYLVWQTLHLVLPAVTAEFVTQSSMSDTRAQSAITRSEARVENKSQKWECYNSEEVSGILSSFSSSQLTNVTGPLIRYSTFLLVNWFRCRCLAFFKFSVMHCQHNTKSFIQSKTFHVCALALLLF